MNKMCKTLLGTNVFQFGLVNVRKWRSIIAFSNSISTTFSSDSDKIPASKLRRNSMFIHHVNQGEIVNV
ncbi:hypothetical protein AB4304_12820, partial [Vibrio breoganii]